MRIGSEIKRKQSGYEPLHLAGADIIGQAHLLANANEESRPEIAACLIYQFERVAIGAGQARAAEADHEYPLCLVLAALDSLRFAQRCGWLCIGKSKRAGLHLSERLLDELFYLACFNVAKNIDHSVFPDYVTIAKIDQIFLGQVLHSFERAV